MIHSIIFSSRNCIGIFFLSLCFILPIQATQAEYDGTTSKYAPVVNGDALRGLSTINSAESMGAGRITFGFVLPWYQQDVGYLNTPNKGANIFVGTGGFSYGVNSYVDLFTSVSAFAISNYTKDKNSSGLGTIRAGAQGSLPFSRAAFLRMGGMAEIIGGTANDQINTNRSDGYNYFETRTGWDILGKLIQTVMAGSEDFGFKAHLNEGGTVPISRNGDALLLLGAGVQGNLGVLVLGAEINSRTRFSDLAIATDPAWFTPTLTIRTPYHMNVMVGSDLSISGDRDNNQPRALEPYRLFGSLSFSFEMLANKRRAEFEQKKKDELNRVNLAHEADQSAKQVESLTLKAANDSIAYAFQSANGQMQMDSMQKSADMQTAKAMSDSIALVESAKNLAVEKEKRSDAEKKLLSTGELLLDAVYFETGKTIISINSKPYLNIIGKMLIKYPKLQIEVAGYTDNVGSESSNVKLSQGRAEAVRSYLTHAEPALNTTMEAHGYGMSMPKADNVTKEGRLANRRVELRVINKDALLEYSEK